MAATFAEFLTDSLAALILAMRALFWPALFFLAIGLIVKRRALIGDMRRAVSESALNVQIMLFNLLLVAPLIGLGGEALWRAVDGLGLRLVDPEVWAGLPGWVVIAIAIFVGDFTGYWRHRLEHTRWLWPSHAVHHSDTEMTWLTLERFHPVNRVTTFLVDTAALLVLGFPPYALIANGLVRHYYGFFIHADLPWTYGTFGRVFVSPAMHRWHHCAEPRFFDANYATVFSIFDRAFGTFDLPGPCDATLGVTDAIAPTLAGQLGYALSPRAYRGGVASEPVGAGSAGDPG